MLGTLSNICLIGLFLWTIDHFEKMFLELFSPFDHLILIWREERKKKENHSASFFPSVEAMSGQGNRKIPFWKCQTFFRVYRFTEGFFFSSTFKCSTRGIFFFNFFRNRVFEEPKLNTVNLTESNRYKFMIVEKLDSLSFNCHLSANIDMDISANLLYSLYSKEMTAAVNRSKILNIP